MKNSTPLVIAFTILLLSFQTTYSQNSGDFILKLQSGTITTTENIDDFKIDQSEPMLNGYVYRIIQFFEVPATNQREGLAGSGVLLMDYLPINSYIAAIPVNIDRSILKKYGVRSVIEFSAGMKISKNLSAGIPDWAIRPGDKVALDVKIHNNIELISAETMLRSQGYEVTEVRSFGNIISIISGKDKVNQIASMPFVYFVDAVSAPSTPDDNRARSLHRVNAIQNEFLGGRNYTGAGVTVAIADDGGIGPHIDFTGRVTDFNTGLGGTHGDMTAGIMVGAGNLNPDYKGSATGAYINMYSINGYTHIVDAVTNYNNLSTVITSTSYSQGSGGVYTADAQAIDNQIRTNPQLIHVFSAGNAGSNFSTITGGYKAAKSVIACGNLNGFDVLENSSSRGPAEDGRIKPDICANGYQQMSTDPNNTYAPGGGTSAASPSVAAVVTCLYEAYKTLNNVPNPPSALIKAAMLNSAEDLGNPGPDYKHGWGRVNALRALTTLEDSRYLSAVVDQGDSNLHVITVPAGVSEMRVMVYWADYEGSPASSIALVNDLNMVLTTPGGINYNPWTLNPVNPNANAVRNIDNLNPVEQVTLDNPTSGSYTVAVKGFAVPQGPQEYYLVYEFRTDSIMVTYPAGGEGFVPGQAEHIRWEAHDNTGTFLLEYTADNGLTWNTISNAVNADLRFYTWVVPNNVTGEARVRVTRGTVSGMSQEMFTISGVPQNISFISVCPDSVTLSWTNVNGAMGYEVYRLGAMYMDSIAYTTNTIVQVAGTDPTQDSWYSVRAVMPNGNKGRRANAVYKSPGLLNCVLAYDADLDLVSPAGGIVFGCQNITAQQVTIDLVNNGANPLTNIPVYYSINGGTPVAEVYTGPIQPGATFTYSFLTTINLSTPDTLELVTWVDYPGDNNFYNDSASTTVIIVSGILVTVPWIEDFESFGLCSTASNCEAENCNLSNGFLNQPNIEIDDVDWRTNSGTTPSSNTGPTTDHTLGNGQGKYLYVEASACFQREAHLSTPCIDLTNVSSPELTFWYHMNGADMGSLHLDILYNGVWTLNAMPPISGNQGNNWQQAIVDLSTFTGNVVTLRFRANTGNDYQSDIAIDDINILEVISPPLAQFTADITSICPGQTVNFTDLSVNSPTQWQWTITPATVTFVNGTSNTSQHPQVQFNASGNYDVTLMASNNFGTNTLVQNAYINVNSGASLPLTENFQAAAYPPVNWQIDAAGGAYTWEQSNSITGADGNSTLASYVNNFSYNNVGAEDGLLTPTIDLPAGMMAVMTFDVSYAPYSNGFSDTLRLDISTDCGVSFTTTSYLKGGSILATVPNQNTVFSPSAANEWRKDSLILNSFAGNSVVLKFVNINGYGNSLFIDNVNIDFITSAPNISETNKDFSIYPNPSREEFNLSFINITGNINVSIIDSKGSLVLEDNFYNLSSTLEKKIKLNKYLPGIYFVTVKTGEQVINKKLVVY